MKKKFALVAVAALIASSITGCTFSREIAVKQKNGTVAVQKVKCVGLVNMDEKLPNVKYEVKTSNVVVGLLLGGAPIIGTAAIDLKCPVADTTISQ